MASTEDKKSLGQVIDGLEVMGTGEALDLSKYYTVGAVVLLKVVPLDGNSTASDLAVLWNEDLDYISRVGMVQIAKGIIESSVYLEADSDEEE